MNQILRKIVLPAFLILSISTFAQNTSDLNLSNLSNVNVDDLSDQQVLDFWQQAQDKGLSISQLEQFGAQKNMDQAQMNKLKGRIEALQASGNKGTIKSTERTFNGVETKPIVVKSKVFGASLFSDKSLTFEPNLKIATPKNYVLGTDDELLIDISGYSEVGYKLKINPEGKIRIPIVGPINVMGLTIEQASKKIARQLSNHYSGILTGETQVSVTLGNIRSIKVTILGEVVLPGTYTLPSLATVFNALYASGGPDKNGSFRNIKLIRNGKTIAIIDVYEFLLKGEAKGNVRLQDQDVIKIGTYETRVELVGEIKRPGLYEVTRDEKLSDIIGFAGGFTDNAYKDRIKVFRNTAKEKSVADVPQDLFPMFVPQTGDVYTIDKGLDRFSNRVELDGAVFRPGYFALDEGMTVSKLIAKADGLREDAVMGRGLIYRLKEDNSLEALSFDVKEVLSGKDIPLKREDKVKILSKLEIREEYSVYIVGEVLRPGKYPYAENLRVEDLILTAGGTKESAAKNKIEIARRVKDFDANNPGSEVSKIITYEVNDELKTIEGKDIILLPFDVVSIYKLTGYQSQRNVKLEGEISHPGQYTLTRNNEKISDLIIRSGGLTGNAFADGAILFRTRKPTSFDQYVKKKKIASFEKQSNDTLGKEDLQKSGVEDSISIVGINLKKIMENPGSKYDLVLEENDVIRIPRLLQTVTVSGEVLYPVGIQYEKGKSFNDYVDGAGGYTQKGLNRKAFVVYANGSAASTRKILFVFNKHPKIKPGSEIIVPAKDDRKKLSTVEVASIVASLSTLILMFYTVSQ